ncbi:MAG: hypothetical protein M3405_12945 [Acidobacteriota bacterium]|nr:hypothetical protein [Acidobacteriota bacterium]
MNKTKNGKRIMENEEIAGGDELEIVDGELLEISDDEIDELNDVETKVSAKEDNKISFPKTEDQKPKTENQNSKYYLQYVFLPLIFLTVTLLGGLRIGIDADEFIFLKPALICLIFGAILLVLFFRAKLIRLDGWFSEDFTTLKNIANGAVIFSLFTASTQIFNSLIPEQGLPFWIIAFCFFWTLWNNLFAEFDVKRLLQSLGGLFGLAFVVKYLVLANIVPTEQGNWLTRIWENPTQEFITYILDIPRFSSATGYIQFFAIIFFLIGLFLLKPRTNADG